MLLDTCVVEGGCGDVNAYAIPKQQSTTLMGIKVGCPSKNLYTVVSACLSQILDMNTQGDGCHKKDITNK